MIPEQATREILFAIANAQCPNAPQLTSSSTILLVQYSRNPARKVPVKSLDREQKHKIARTPARWLFPLRTQSPNTQAMHSQSWSSYMSRFVRSERKYEHEKRSWWERQTQHLQHHGHRPTSSLPHLSNTSRTAHRGADIPPLLGIGHWLPRRNGAALGTPRAAPPLTDLG